jgi:hypothetical protein
VEGFGKREHRHARARALAVLVIGIVLVPGTAAAAPKRGGGSTPPPPAVADLEVVGIVDNHDPYVHEQHSEEGLIYRVTVRNLGPDSAPSVRVKGTLRGNGLGSRNVYSDASCTGTWEGRMVFTGGLRSTDTQWSYSCDVGALAVGEEEHVDIKVMPSCFSAGDAILDAAVEGTTDSNSANQSSVEETQIIAPKC